MGSCNQKHKKKKGKWNSLEMGSCNQNTKKGKWNRHLLVWMKPLRISLSNAISWQSEWCLGVLALTDSGLIRIVACYLHFFTTFQVWTIMILKKLTNKNIHDYHLSCCCWFYLFFFFFNYKKRGQSAINIGTYYMQNTAIIYIIT